jgi:hypothetical protein
MFRLGRKAFVAYLLILYGSVSVCGASLHAVLEKTLAHHDHGPVKTAGATISGVSHDCLLCEFCAQGQLLVDMPRPASRLLATPHVSIAPALPNLPERHTSCHPRAPPCLRASNV